MKREVCQKRHPKPLTAGWCVTALSGRTTGVDGGAAKLHLHLCGLHVNNYDGRGTISRIEKCPERKP